ncbi:FAD-binding dehydrogenase [Longimycelium tulufanense]|uniref:FAD-binding dehydrogenase n=1 Tax=Longimycelium tulufanense TaxID=907463 RepID=A0A8J3C7Q1_9PSEU|nr:FAD-binding dehydrogenase [Longimycelium tulufanense]
MDADVIVVGAGLAGLVATYELVRAGRSVLVVEQENENNLGGQAFWSLGGLFFVNSPAQRRLGIRDSYELALQDWFSSAGFDREREDHWPRQWAQRYVEFAAGEKWAYLHHLGVRIVPTVGWAERGSGTAAGHGNSVPRFHMAWGTGPGVLEVFRDRVLEAARAGLVSFRYRHQVDELLVTDGAVHGVCGTVLEPSTAPRGVRSSRTPVGTFELHAQAVLVTSGGIGGNQELVRKNWPSWLGTPPRNMLTGVPAHVDGRMLEIAETAGANIVNRDRMWHYTEGVANWNPIWPNHAIRILPGPSSLWLDATGQRLPAPYFPGFDNMATFKYIRDTGYDHTWFVLDQTIVEKEFALSGSEQNPDITSKSRTAALGRIRKGAPGPIAAFLRHGEDFVVRSTLRELVDGMNAVTAEPLLSYERVAREVLAHDRELGNSYGKDLQIAAIQMARRFYSDRLVRVVKPHRLLDPRHGPLIAVRLRPLTRKTLGGLETNLDSQVIRPDGSTFDGLYAAGEVAGFGGGGVHGHNALEGTFLGGCIFSGRTAGRALARALA